MNPRPKPRKFMVAVLASGVGASLAAESCSNGLPGASLPVYVGMCIDGSASCSRDGGADVNPIGVPPAPVDGGDASDDAASDAADAGAPGDAAAKG